MRLRERGDDAAGEGPDPRAQAEGDGDHRVGIDAAEARPVAVRGAAAHRLARSA